MELLRDEEREEDGLLPDWTVRPAAPPPPPEETGGDMAVERFGAAAARQVAPQAGPAGEGPEEDAGADVREVSALSGPPGRMEGETETPGRLARAAAELAAKALVGGMERPDGTALRGAEAGTDGDSDGTVPEEVYLPLNGTAVQIRRSGPSGERRDGGMSGRSPSGGQERNGAYSGVKRLYRQTARAVSPAGPAVSGGAARTVREEEPAAALTMEELDRAMRRDSWRYDGEMGIY